MIGSTVETIIERQCAPINGAFEFKCENCKHNMRSDAGYPTVGCRMNIFITTVGCNTSDCVKYEKI